MATTSPDLGATGIPIELTGAQKFAITDNIITGVGTRGISMGGLFDGVVSGNSIHGQSTYGVELNTLTRVNIVGNTIVNCCAGMSGQAGSDLLITAQFHRLHDGGREQSIRRILAGCDQ